MDMAVLLSHEAGEQGGLLEDAANRWPVWQQLASDDPDNS